MLGFLENPISNPPGKFHLSGYSYFRKSTIRRGNHHNFMQTGEMLIVSFTLTATVISHKFLSESSGIEKCTKYHAMLILIS